MTREEAKAEINKEFEPAFANYIITALTEGATPSERKTGKWIWREDEKYYDTPTGNATYECSLCHHSDVHAKTKEVPYCWWCGAKMEVDE